MLDHIITLLMLVMLQAVLGFDNLLYISLESKKAPLERQSYVRKMGIGLAVVFRIVLLFVLFNLISYFQKYSFTTNSLARLVKSLKPITLTNELILRI